MRLIHQIALTLIKGIGPVTVKRLLEKFESPEAIFAANKAQLLHTGELSTAAAEAILQTDALVIAAKQLKFVEKYQIDILFFTDRRFPQRLKNCADAPVLLYYQGQADLNAPRIVSIVGTRTASPYGLMLCEQLVATLQPYNVMIVSGLAYGIDAAAHKQSLAYDIPTLGVLGHGLERIYPASHQQLAKQMLKKGGLLTEFCPFSVIGRENFPRRNRIIAGISDVTIVVEAALKGGALITADIANSYARDVFAFPGKTTDDFSAGCNFLIKTNRAGLLSHARDLVYNMGWDTVMPITTHIPSELKIALSAPELAVIQALKESPLLVEELGIHSGLPQSKLAFCLLNLEIRGLIAALPGNRYQLL